MGEWQSLPALLSHEAENTSDGRPGRMSDSAFVCDWPGCETSYDGPYAAQALGRHRAHHSRGGSGSVSGAGRSSQPVRGGSNPPAATEPDTDAEETPEMPSDADNGDGQRLGQSERRLLARFYQPTSIAALDEMFSGLDVFVRPSDDGFEIVERIG